VSLVTRISKPWPIYYANILTLRWPRPFSEFMNAQSNESGARQFGRRKRRKASSRHTMCLRLRLASGDRETHDFPTQVVNQPNAIRLVSMDTVRFRATLRKTALASSMCLARNSPSSITSEPARQNRVAINSYRQTMMKITRDSGLGSRAIASCLPCGSLSGANESWPKKCGKPRVLAERWDFPQQYVTRGPQSRRASFWPKPACGVS